jgi:DNA-binding MarR family transcriptional regulator
MVVIASSCKNNYIAFMSATKNNISRADAVSTRVVGDGIIHLANYWPYQLIVLADRVSRRTARVVKDKSDLNLSQWRVLAAIAEVPGRTSAEVVTVTPMDKGIVSRATKTLLELGLVVREASQDDGRISHLHLTTKGEALYAALMPGVSAVLTRAAETLTSTEQEGLSDQLKQLLAVIPDQR